MVRSKTIVRIGALPIAVALLGSIAQAGIADFHTWRKVTDPAHALLTSSVDSASQISLMAGDGPIATATDIGYQSVRGSTAATSTAGYAFSPAASFRVAVNYAMSFQDPIGGLVIGLGVGEDIDGRNSGGVVLVTSGGVVLGSAAGGRTNDANVDPVVVDDTDGSLSGSLFVAYDAATGSITAGVGATDAASPTKTGTLTGIQNNWNEALLFPAFFLRSDSFLGGEWQSGTASAVFSNFRVLSGTPIAVPEPSTIALLAWLALALPWACRGGRRRAP